MKILRRQSRANAGLTLPEVAVVLAIAASLVALAIPSISVINSSFESTGALNMISGALSSARARAVQHQRYAGVRFQCDRNGNQYIIPIIHDREATGLANGFRAVEGSKPIKLPINQGVMDLRMRTSDSAQYAPDAPIDEDADIAPEADGTEKRLSDTTTFSILFSPSGKLVVREVRIRRGAVTDDNRSADRIFDTRGNVEDGFSMFYQDDYPELGLGAEHTRTSFVVYDKSVFSQVDSDLRWSEYLSTLQPVRINPYTGCILKAEQVR